MSVSQDNKRIVKNTAYMYFRMGITMLVGLYTSRIVLQVLGVEDFGLYNVIGGIIAMFAFLNNAMVNATSRFITVRLAKHNVVESSQIFNMSLLIHVIIAIAIFVLGESLGLWYLQNKLVIPEGREFAAELLYQLSILTCLLSIVGVPFNASVIAHEKMDVFAWIQILDVFLKLGIAILLKSAPFDKLIFYGTLLAGVYVLNFFIYFLYCKKEFVETKFQYYWNSRVFHEMMGFAGWALAGNFSNFFYTQGLNLMLNAFCGPAVNAARGIAVQVENLVKTFANNVQVSINPQIIKSYASNELQRMHTLICFSSRICYYLLFLISLPIMLEADFLLHLWLGIVPSHTVNFIRITLVIVLLDAFINPMFTANLATGKLNQYYIPIFSLSFSFMFITYFTIRCTNLPESVFLCYLTLTCLGVLTRIIVMGKQINLNPGKYVNQVILPVLGVTFFSSFFPIITHNVLGDGWIRLIITIIVSTISVSVVVCCVGISRTERQMIIQFVKQKISKND